VDEYEGGIRIIDYKTGNCELNVKSISDLFDPTLSKRAKEVFQVLTYCEFLMHQNSIAKELVPCLFRMGRFRAGDSDHRVRVDGKEIVFSDVRNDFNQGLRGILEELFNPQLPFVQTTDVNRCRYCPFTGICSR
jgi:argonaute-like protein implicated in RNA metabolism and viral defense